MQIKQCVFYWLKWLSSRSSSWSQLSSEVAYVHSWITMCISDPHNSAQVWIKRTVFFSSALPLYHTSLRWYLFINLFLAVRYCSIIAQEHKDQILEEGKKLEVASQLYCLLLFCLNVVLLLADTSFASAPFLLLLFANAVLCILN